jgi:hypothetical protein
MFHDEDVFISFIALVPSLTHSLTHVMASQMSTFPPIRVDINGYAVAKDDRSRDYVVYVISVSQVLSPYHVYHYHIIINSIFSPLFELRQTSAGMYFEDTQPSTP